MWITTETFLATLVERQMWLTLGYRGKLELHPKGSYKTLTAEERNFLQSRNAKLKKLAAAAPGKVLGWLQPRTQPEVQSQPVAVPPVSPPAKPTTELEPEVYARGVRITEDIVREAMEAAGELHDYEAGRISKVEAYERARVRERQLQTMLGRLYPRWPR